MADEKKRRSRVLQGTVCSDKMDKTIVVEVKRRVPHPTYKKYITRRVRYKAHDEQNQCNIGDNVLIVQCRPMSRDKRWRLQKLVDHVE
jgi:small subunit ribosomal protein S17